MRTFLSFALLAALPAAAFAFDTVQVVKPDALQGVQQVYVAEVATDLPAPASRFDDHGPRPVRPRDAATKAADLAKELKRGLARDFEVVASPGPGVLVVKPTLTRLASSRPTLADFEREPGLSHESVYAGGATVTVALERDGATVGTLSDTYTGTFGDGNPRVGIWQDADRAFSRWGRQLPGVLAPATTAAR
ncbi:MAG: DUF3313 family protein [Lysobacteraceae bacterium]|jgi:hypothetical protein|nr:DUF3313 family protein [Silanimonas sp.]